MVMGKVIDPGWQWDDKIPLAQAVKVGEVLYISGQIALDPAGALVGAGDMRAQSQRVFENIEAILKMAGGTLENVVKITAYLTDMRRYGEYNEVRGRFLKDHRPASTTVQVVALAFPGLLVEVEAIAHL
ncbi:MAG: RidA family protein [Acidobacteria bacterium]|nr:RidA family protein [Acidobacteriota bacterium]